MQCAVFQTSKKNLVVFVVEKSHSNNDNNNDLATYI